MTTGQYITKIRPKILKRDNYACQECGRSPIKEKHLHVHHIKEDGVDRGYWNKKGNHSSKNLITLCCICHGRKHSKRTVIYDDDYLLELRADGKTYREIADLFGVSHQAVQQRVKRIPYRKGLFSS